MEPVPTDWRTEESQELLWIALREALDVLSKIQGQGVLEFWHEKVLTGLTQTAYFCYRNLIAAWKEEGLSPAAWSARSLLEAEIWMRYVTASKGNARRFYMDWVNDASELMNKMASNEEWAASSPYRDLDFKGTDVNAARGWISSLRASPELVDDDYLKVAAVAKELGRGVHFSKFNKLLSKLAHPTAFSVLSVPSERARTNMSVLILDEGANACMRCVSALNDFLKAQNFPRVF